MTVVVVGDIVMHAGYQLIDDMDFLAAVSVKVDQYVPLRTDLRIGPQEAIWARAFARTASATGCRSAV